MHLGEGEMSNITLLENGSLSSNSIVPSQEIGSLRMVCGILEVSPSYFVNGSQGLCLSPLFFILFLYGSS